eukprot:763817-Hanusia_phi.AAC.1
MAVFNAPFIQSWLKANDHAIFLWEQPVADYNLFSLLSIPSKHQRLSSFIQLPSIRTYTGDLNYTAQGDCNGHICLSILYDGGWSPALKVLKFSRRSGSDQGIMQCGSEATARGQRQLCQDLQFLSKEDVSSCLSVVVTDRRWQPLGLPRQQSVNLQFKRGWTSEQFAARDCRQCRGLQCKYLFFFGGDCPEKLRRLHWQHDETAPMKHTDMRTRRLCDLCDKYRADKYRDSEQPCLGNLQPLNADDGGPGSAASVTVYTVLAPEPEIACRSINQCRYAMTDRKSELLAALPPGSLG